MRHATSFKKVSSQIRFRLLTAFFLVVLVSIAAVLTAWFSISRTQQQIDTVMGKTLPLESHFKILDKETALFATAINDLPGVRTEQEHAALMIQLQTLISEIKNQLNILDSLGFEKDQIKFLRDHVWLLVKSMNTLDQFAFNFIKEEKKLTQVVSNLKRTHEEFLKVADLRIKEGLVSFLERGDRISAQLRKVIVLLSKENSDDSIQQIDDKLRVGIGTLVSSAAGEMKSNLELTALTHLASSILHEAANSPTLDKIQELQETFNALLPKVKKTQLILAHSSVENNQVLITALPLFKYGQEDPSIFQLRTYELKLRNAAAQSAIQTLELSKELAKTINTLSFNSQHMAGEASATLRTNLKQAIILEIIALFLAILIAILIGWFYVERRVIRRLSALKESMRIHAAGEKTTIPKSGDDEITDMANALESFVHQRSYVENKLRLTLNELNAVMDSIDYGVVFMDAELKASIINSALKKMWQLKEHDVIGNPSFRELLSLNRDEYFYGNDEQFEKFLDKWEKLLKAGDITPSVLSTKAGKTFQYQCINLPDGDHMITLFDITLLKETQEKLTQSQKMEAIGLMAGGVAHDLNNILSGIVTYPDLLLLKLPPDSELQTTIQAIKDSGRRAADVVADLLTVARGVAAARDIANVNRLIVDYLNSPECKNFLPRFPDLVISTDLDPDISLISCSTIHIKKCLMNLVMNAAEAINGKGSIHITTQNSYINKPFHENNNLEEGEYVTVSIRDNGPGISQEDLSHIFEPFYTKKNMGRSGTGLGLTIVWNTVQEHNGSISVSSNRDGTVFTMFFPVSQEAAKENIRNIDTSKLYGNGQKILVVDDDPQQRDIAGQIIETLNYSAVTASSGEEAVALFKEGSFDLLILDMIMTPGINGRMTYEQIVAIEPDQKAILASGFTDGDDVRKTMQMGTCSFIKKPYSLKEIGLEIKKMLT